MKRTTTVCLVLLLDAIGLADGLAPHLGRHATAKIIRAPPPSALGPSSLAGLATLTGVIVIHELGHFSVARAQGIRVNSFNVGFGPKVWGVDRGERPDVAVRLLPIGGFVEFPRYLNRTKLLDAGYERDDVEELLESAITDPADPDLLENRPFAGQAAVIVAGVAANVVLAWSLFFGGAASVGVPVFELDQPVCVRRVAPNSAAALGGLRPGDQLLTVGGTAMPRVSRSPSLLDEAVATIRAATKDAVDRNGPVAATLVRDGKELRLLVPPQRPPTPTAPTPPLGVELAAQCGAVRREKLAVPAAAARATSDTSRGLRAVGAGLAQILGGLLSGGARPDVQGPLGIAQSGASIAARDPSQLLAFGAMLSLNLALLNSLPLPGLDGFQLLVLSGEKATGRKLSDDAQGAISGATALLFLLIAGSSLAADAGNAGVPVAGIATGIRQILPSLVIGVALAQGASYLRQRREDAAEPKRGLDGGNAHLYE